MIKSFLKDDFNETNNIIVDEIKIEETIMKMNKKKIKIKVNFMVVLL